MFGFYLVNERRFPLKALASENDLLPYHRWEHRVTVGYGSKRFQVLLDNLQNTIYIEEITDGSRRKIDNDKLFEEITTWAHGQGFLNMLQPICKIAGERFI